MHTHNATCIWIHTCMVPFLCLNVHIYTDLCKFIYIYIYIYIYALTHMSVFPSGPKGPRQKNVHDMHID